MEPSAGLSGANKLISSVPFPAFLEFSNSFLEKGIIFGRSKNRRRPAVKRPRRPVQFAELSNSQISDSLEKTV
jgi:hypothetical protein